MTRLATFGGFAAFFVMEKTLRVLGAEGHDHSAHEPEHEHTNGASTAVDAASADKGGLRQRKKDGNEKEGHEHHHHQHEHQSKSGPSKLSAYLNLFGDFVHNMCVVASSFARCIR